MKAPKSKATKSATLLIAGTLMAGTASAMTLDGVSSATDLNVTVSNGVATLYGHVDNSFERVLAEVAAEDIEGVEIVRNLVTVSD